MDKQVLVLFKKKNNKVLFKKKNYKKIKKRNCKKETAKKKLIKIQQDGVVGKTWVSRRGWGGRGNLGFPTFILLNNFIDVVWTSLFINKIAVVQWRKMVYSTIFFHNIRFTCFICIFCYI